MQADGKNKMAVRQGGQHRLTQTLLRVPPCLGPERKAHGEGGLLLVVEETMIASEAVSSGRGRVLDAARSTAARIFTRAHQKPTVAEREKPHLAKE